MKTRKGASGRKPVREMSYDDQCRLARQKLRSVLGAIVQAQNVLSIAVPEERWAVQVLSNCFDTVNNMLKELSRRMNG